MIILVGYNFTNAQAPSAIWQKCYGGSNDDYISTLPLQTTDGGFLLGLVTTSNDGNVSGNHGGGDISVIKTNAVGNVQWQKCYGGTGNDGINDLVSTTDGGYIIAGNTSSNDGDVSGYHGANDAWIVKINALGTIVWKKCFGGSEFDEIEEIIPTSDGGYIAVATTSSIDNGDVVGNTGGGSWLFKINDLGAIQWQHVYNYSINSVIQTPDGGYIYDGIAVDSSFPGFHGGSDILLTKVNQGGNIQWQKCYGGSGIEESPQIIASNDGGYFLTSYTNSNDGDVYGNHGLSDAWLVKLDAYGLILSQNCYGGSGDDGGGLFQKTLDGGILLLSSTNSNDGNVSGNHGGYDAWSIKLSSTGVIQWQKCFGGTNDDYGGAFQLADGTYMAIGNSLSNNGDISGNHGVNTADAFLIKLTAANLGTENFTTQIISIYPNPAKDIITIDCGNLANVNGWNVKISNTLGQEVFDGAMNTQQYVVQLNSLGGQGVYYIRIYDGANNLMNTKKIILQ